MSHPPETPNTTMSHPPETPPLCANGCGFFGTPATNNNLRSKCYRDHLKQELAAKEKSTSRMITVSSREELATSIDRLLSLGPEFGDNNVNSNDHTNCMEKKRSCLCCKKKIRLLGFPCRCGGIFCSMHRYPEDHSCSFDYKTVGRRALANVIRLVSNDKLETRI